MFEIGYIQSIQMKYYYYFHDPVTASLVVCLFGQKDNKSRSEYQQKSERIDTSIAKKNSNLQKRQTHKIKIRGKGSEGERERMVKFRLCSIIVLFLEEFLHVFPR